MPGRSGSQRPGWPGLRYSSPAERNWLKGTGSINAPGSAGKRWRVSQSVVSEAKLLCSSLQTTQTGSRDEYSAAKHPCIFPNMQVQKI